MLLILLIFGMNKISEDIINDIKNRLVEPSYKTEVERLLYEKRN